LAGGEGPAKSIGRRARDHHRRDAQRHRQSPPRIRGICDNRLTIRRDVLKASVLSGLKTHLMHPDLVKVFIGEYHRELNRLNASREQTHALKVDESTRVNRQIRALVDAVKDGMRTPAMKDELLALEARKAELAAALEHAPAPAPRLHSRLAEIYRSKVANLQEELNRPELRVEAAEAIRSLVEEIRLVPENGKLEIELAGDLAGILALSCGNKKPVSREDELQVTLVAGRGFEPLTFRL
jgi:site-specific DNA recombinase